MKLDKKVGLRREKSHYSFVYGMLVREKFRRKEMHGACMGLKKAYDEVNVKERYSETFYCICCA